VYEQNILVRDGEDKVLTSTKYGSKTSECDTTVKVTYQEIYGVEGLVRLCSFVYLCGKHAAFGPLMASALAIISAVCRRYVLHVSL